MIPDYTVSSIIFIVLLSEQEIKGSGGTLLATTSDDMPCKGLWL